MEERGRDKCDLELVKMSFIAEKVIMRVFMSVMHIFMCISDSPLAPCYTLCVSNYAGILVNHNLQHQGNLWPCLKSLELIIEVFFLSEQDLGRSPIIIHTQEIELVIP